MIIREIEDSTEDIAHVWDLDTRESDHGSDSYLHHEAEYGRNANPWSSNRLHIIEEWDDRYESSEDDHDVEAMFEDRCEVEDEVEDRDECKDREKNTNTCPIGNRCSPGFWLVEVRAIETMECSQNVDYTLQDEGWEYRGSDEEDDDLERERHERREC